LARNLHLSQATDPKGRPEVEEGDAKMATKKAKKSGKQLKKAKKLEATKPLTIKDWPPDPCQPT